MPSLHNKELKKPKATAISVIKCHAQCVYMISNMNGVVVKKPLVTKLFCYVVIFKEAVSPKLGVKL